MKRIADCLLRQTVEHLLDALFEVAAVAGARDQRAQIERVDRGSLQRVGHVALVDAQRQPLRERGLPHARLADQERVVLAAPAQHLHHPLDLGGTADERIDPAAGRLGVQVLGVGLERIDRWRLGFAAGHARRARVGRAVRDDAQQGEPIDAARLEEVRGVALVLLEHEHQQVSARHFGRARRGGVHDRALDHAVEADRRFRLDLGRARHHGIAALEDVGGL